jgi:GNAT superfamily N-acetyltransferase
MEAFEMTGGWHGEPARHALAAKGVPTAERRVAREFHSQRPLKDRESDEMRLEPYIEDVAIWAKDPDSYDLAGVDDPVPEGYVIEKMFLSEKGRVEIIVKKKDSKKNSGVLDFRYASTVDDVEYYEFSIYVYSDDRGEGLSRYLLRNMINLADEMGVGIVGIIHPTSGSPLDADLIASYYASFGFVPTGKGYEAGSSFDIVRPPKSMEGST